MNLTSMNHWLKLGLASFIFALTTIPSHAAIDEGPDALVERVSNQVLTTIKSDPKIHAGDLGPITQLVNKEVLPYLDFERMTASAIGRPWKTANAEQKQQLQAGFKALLLRTYAGAFSQVKDQTAVVRPTKLSPGDTTALVRTQIRGGSEPIELDYRLAKGDDGWKVIDINVLGAWLISTYHNQFAQVYRDKGIDGLIQELNSRNQPR